MDELLNNETQCLTVKDSFAPCRVIFIGPACL